MDIYKHFVYNPHLISISAVIANFEINESNEWCFERCQPVTEYEWVAIFRKWVYEEIDNNKKGG